MVYAIKYLFLFGLVNCYSASRPVWSITSKVCLKTALEFPYKCSFTVQTAQDYFKTDRRTCQSKCSITIYRPGLAMYSGTFYSLRRITMYFRDNSTTEGKCARSSNGEESHILVNCSSWKYDEYLIRDGQYCQTHYSSCIPIGYTCFCQCPSGYIMVNGHCLIANVYVGDTCSSNLQCTGTDFSGVCKNHVCHCLLGYLEMNRTCYPAYVLVGNACSLTQQCNGTGHSGVCSYGVCRCQQGYVEINGTCYQGNVRVGNACFSNHQCNGTENSGVCSYGFCQCQPGYLQIDGNCFQGNVPMNQSCTFNHQCSDFPDSACLEGKCKCIDQYINDYVRDCTKRDVLLNQTCKHSDQCSTSPYAACLGGRCKCIDGYKARNDIFCEKGKSSYGGFCSQSDQCTHSTVCKNERCTCKPGFVFINSDCHEIVPLNRSCVHDMQCSRSLYAACSNGKCDCIAGYRAENSNDCVLGDCQEVLDQQQAGCNPVEPEQHEIADCMNFHRDR
uniref:Prion-like-(Q/N-rich) domain-bearing protein 25 isoform X1 n=2 Tax=Crassostrea virginica TaxID=6565 RepID=A0A8B8B041_CRAVI|nr:prion-like-(Q/N-rich) domain-bearing protein 25 isoform X1 [Crassostrea virginica]